MVSQFHKEALYLVLEQYHEHQQTNAHEFIENRADELHFKNLRCEHPYYYKCKHTEEYIDCAALLHYPVKVEEQQCCYCNIKRVSYSKSVHTSNLF